MVKTINISNFANTLTNYTMIDGLTPDIIKRKYIWLLNATVQNAIIGQDSYGLVWYSGNWLSGEWEDGTWYSGIWYDGEWKNGKFYSYRLDKIQLLQRNKRILEKDNPQYSQFRHGIWRRGEFFNGYFGPQNEFEEWENKSYVDVIYHDTRWEGGTFYDGVFRNASWLQSNNQKSFFKNGIFFNSQWINGTFINGTFQGYKWWSGNFTGGDFVLGTWVTGRFNQVNSKIKSRFGSMPITGSTIRVGKSVSWESGDFLNGEFHSGLNVVSGITQISDNHNRTWWYNGTWYNGVWYGGTHVDGIFNNGIWYEGYWSGGTFNNGYWYNGYWEDGIVNNGFFVQGLIKTVVFNAGKLGYQTPQYILDKELELKSGITYLPNVLGSAPVVETLSISGITGGTIVCGGNVISDGGDSVTARGVCWCETEVTTDYGIITQHPIFRYPVEGQENFSTVDGYGTGEYSSLVTGLSSYPIKYYIRAYAINGVRISYGNEIEFSL